MNNKHILDLTLRLSQALDQNYDVVNMEAVVSVISALEGTTITKEQLETTRLAKYINQLRRRTNCENLARRSKSLLKRWREMVGMQQTNEIQAAASVVGYVPHSTAIQSSTTTDNAVSNSQLTDPQCSHQHYQIHQHESNVKQQQSQQPPYCSEPSSPVNIQEKSNPNEFLFSISNPATGSQVPKSSNTNIRKKRKLEKNVDSATNTQQPTSFANLITGLSNTQASSRKSTREKVEAVTSTTKPVETFIIEHSSNSNSDLICIPSNNTVSSNFTSATNVPPVVIDLQDTNSSMNSLVSKDVSSTLYQNKVPTKKPKKEKKRKERNTTLHQNHPLDCDDENATVTSCQNKPTSSIFIIDEKSRSAGRAISNISALPNENKPKSGIFIIDEKSRSAGRTMSNMSEILSLSNSSMSSVFPSSMSKNVIQSQNQSASSSMKMSKSDLTFAGKFKRNASTTSTGCNVLNYNSDSINTSAVSNTMNRSKFSMFGGTDSNSNDSSSCSRTLPFHDVVYAVNTDENNIRQHFEDGVVLECVNEKSTSNMSNKGNSSTDNTFALAALATSGPKSQQSSCLKKEVSSQKAIKMPKKRGRKKGSKGVDSVIARESSLSSQMLLTPLGVAGKKVKTTKELYAEMESRKFRNVKAVGLREQHTNLSTNLPGKQQRNQQKSAVSRCPSLSDIADSNSSSTSSAPSGDSGNILTKASKGKREIQLDNNSKGSKHDCEFKAEGAKALENSILEITKIRHKIQEMLKLLGTPPSVKEIEHECFKSITPCTCTIEEVTVPPNNFNNVMFGDDGSKNSKLVDTNSTNIDGKETEQWRITNDQTTSVTENMQLAISSQRDTSLRPAPVKMKKSIFDLDFDEGEDPLNSIIADIEGKNIKISVEITKEAIDENVEFPLKTEYDHGKIDHQNVPYALNVPTSNSDNIVFPSLETKFDPNCEAKNRFELQTQKITKFHIDTLHNCYIPNVNGNWNHANAVYLRSCINYENNFQELNSIVDGCDVVPLYGSDVTEHIAKDLSHVKFSKKFNLKHSKRENLNEVLFHVPFLGVSRIPDIIDTKLRCKDLKKLTLDEEKENVDYKSNLDNIILNASAFDADDAKEREDTEVKCEQKSLNTRKLKNKNVRKISFKRTKRHTKRSAIKRLKKTVNGACETKTRDLSDPDNSDHLKLHKRLFYHEELRPTDRNDTSLSNRCLFHISSCSSGCSSVDEDDADDNIISRIRLNSTSTSSSSSSSSSSESEYYVSNLQQIIIQSELTKRESDVTKSSAIEGDETINKISPSVNDEEDDGVLSNFDDNELPKENNRMLLSFNNIYNKSTRDENAEQQNKEHENTMLKQQLQNCDDHKNLNNNLNIIKLIDNKNHPVYNINNNNSCSNNYSDTNVNLSSSSSENPTDPAFVHHHNNNDNDVQIRPLKEYQTGMRAVDEDVNDDDGNNCGRLQQFKEWHEVLQLRSYNDELLTVLPYVILE